MIRNLGVHEYMYNRSTNHCIKYKETRQDSRKCDNHRSSVNIIDGR